MLNKSQQSKRRTALGQGLDALLPLDQPETTNVSADNISQLPIESLLPNPYQPRRRFSEESLVDLSNSIKEMGVIQPLIVRARPDGNHEIVAGERRWRASKMAGFSTIPAIVRSVSDSESLEIALIENLQREDLNPLDTAEAYDTLISKFSYTHDDLAKRMGKDRSSVTNHVRLLKLPDPIKEDLRRERLSMGHARTLLAVDHLPTQLKFSSRTIAKNLTVRDLERIVQNYKKKKESSNKTHSEKDLELRDLETSLSRHFSTRVKVKTNPNYSGHLQISFHSKEELDRLLAIMGFGEDFA